MGLLLLFFWFLKYTLCYLPTGGGGGGGAGGGGTGPCNDGELLLGGGGALVLFRAGDSEDTRGEGGAGGSEVG